MEKYSSYINIKGCPECGNPSYSKYPGNYCYRHSRCTEYITKTVPLHVFDKNIFMKHGTTKKVTHKCKNTESYNRKCRYHGGIVGFYNLVREYRDGVINDEYFENMIDDSTTTTKTRKIKRKNNKQEK